jgi:hypothetical protein
MRCTWIMQFGTKKSVYFRAAAFVHNNTHTHSPAIEGFQIAWCLFLGLTSHRPDLWTKKEVDKKAFDVFDSTRKQKQYTYEVTN